MCGRYGYVSGKKIIDYFELSESIDIEPNYNAAPSQNLPVVIKDGGKLKLEIMRWGLVPFWAKDMRTAQINARSEGIEEKAFFRKPFKKQRCLVPASYFFEWMKTKDNKIPYLIKARDREVFAFAGVYDVVKDGDGRKIKSFAIITTEPNRVVAKIHNRMPVILEKEDEREWLKENAGISELKKLLKPFESAKTVSYPVSKLVNDPANNKEGILNAV